MSMNKNIPSFSKYRESEPVIFLLTIFRWPRNQIRAIYKWVVGWAEKKQAEKALAGIAFIESSFFPIPPDPLLVAMVMAKPAKFLRFAAICTLASTAGGAFGYFIGIALFASIGQWIVDTYGLQEAFHTIGVRYEENAFLTVFTAAFTPIPYKLITIAAGVFQISFTSLIIASLFGRGGRFFLVAFLMHHLGSRYKDSIEKYIDIISIAFVGVLVLGVFALKYL